MNSEYPSPADDLIALCDQLLDAELRPEQQARLESLVLQDPKLRRLYVELMQVHAHLVQHSARLSSASLMKVLEPLQHAASAPRSRRSWLASSYLWKAAAAITFIAALSWWLSDADTKRIARLEEADGARWENSSLPTEPGSGLGAGRLRLAEGLARIRFQSGAEITLEGPAELELIEAQLCRLHRGSLTAHVPEQARGFTVLTREARLIDHGTDFGITTDADGSANVHVMKGEVELQHRLGGPPLHLLTDQMTAINAQGMQPARPLDAEPQGPETEVTPASRFTHEVSTAVRRGAASYVTSPGTDRHFSNSLLLIKNAPGRSFLRKAVLRFDLDSTLQWQALQEAELTLQFAPSGYGYASLGGAAQLVVYAVTQDALDDWQPNQLTWDAMPAFHPDAGRVDETLARRVGELTLPRGVLRGAFSISGPRLVEALRRDGNRLLTLIIVRENPLDHAPGVVHGIAGNQHPTLPPPMLRLRFE